MGGHKLFVMKGCERPWSAVSLSLGSIFKHFSKKSANSGSSSQFSACFKGHERRKLSFMRDYLDLMILPSLSKNIFLFLAVSKF